MRFPATLRQIEAFRALAVTLSFTKAAQEVHLSQPALSASIKKLEEIFDAQLFDRTTRQVRLTPVGEALLAALDGVFHDFYAALDTVTDFVAGKRGTLRVAASPSLAAAFLPSVIAAFEKGRADVTLQVHEAMSEISLEMVRTGKADLALAPEKRSDDGLEHCELFQDSLMLLCRSDHPLAARKTITWRDLQSHRLISQKPTSSVRHLLDAAYLTQGLILKPAFEIEHVSTVIGFVANGLGIGVLPMSLMPNVRAGNLTSRRITHPEISRTICAVSLRGRSLSPTAQAFIDLCTVIAKQRGAPGNLRNGGI